MHKVFSYPEGWALILPTPGTHLQTFDVSRVKTTVTLNQREGVCAIKPTHEIYSKEKRILNLYEHSDMLLFLNFK